MMRAGSGTGMVVGHKRRLVVIAMASALAACAPGSSPGSSPGPAGSTAASTAPVAASTAATSVDGLYRGQVVITQNRDGLCNYGQPIMGVKDGKVSRMWNGTRVYAPVGADGSFSGQGGRAFLTGTIQNGKMDAEMFDEYCRFKFSLTKT